MMDVFVTSGAGRTNRARGGIQEDGEGRSGSSFLGSPTFPDFPIRAHNPGRRAAGPAASIRREMAGESCCPPQSWPGVLEDASREQLSGEEVTIESGLNMYVTGAGGRAIVVVHDVFGFSGGRIKSVCDSFAEEGFLVCLPDLYGASLSIADVGGFGSEGGTKMLRENDFAKVRGQLGEALAHLEGLGATSVGLLGFCWGAYMVFKACQEEAKHALVRAAVSAHPSLKVSQLIYDDDAPEDLAAKVAVPQLLLPAGNDDAVYKDGTLTGIMAERGVEGRSIPFEDMRHGWVPRGDASDPAVASAVFKAVREGAAFFRELL